MVIYLLLLPLGTSLATPQYYLPRYTTNPHNGLKKVDVKPLLRTTYETKEIHPIILETTSKLKSTCTRIIHKYNQLALSYTLERSAFNTIARSFSYFDRMKPFLGCSYSLNKLPPY
jgi:hypothetical protein